MGADPSDVVALGTRRKAGPQPRCSVERGFAKAVKIDAAAVRKLDASLRALIDKLRYRAELVDGSRLTFEDVEAVLAFDNPKLRAITSLCITGGYLTDCDVTVEISRQTEYRKPVQLRISGPDDIVMQIARDFEMWLGDVEESRIHSWIVRWNWAAIVLALGVMTFLVLPAVFTISSAVTTGNTSLTSEKTTELSGLGHLLGWAFIAAPFVFAFPLGWFRAKFWPAASFAIGAGHQRYEREKTMRTVISTTFVFPFLMGMLFLLF